MNRLSTESLLLARPGVDRDTARRTDPNLFDHLWNDARTRILPMFESSVPVVPATTGTGYSLALFTTDDVPAATGRVYLGISTDDQSPEPIGSPLVLAQLSDGGFRSLADKSFQWVTLREIGGDLSARDAALFAEAQAMDAWHERSRFCPQCGSPTLVTDGGWLRRCLNDEFEVYPRMDPAVIVAVLDQDERLLLGARTDPPRLFSVLAGFVEAGESLETAVVREIREESGLKVQVEDYLGSQPWPFPQSLMFGFSARVVGDPTPTPDGDEIKELRWVDRDAFEAEMLGMRLPAKISIARAMIEQWLGHAVAEPNAE